MITIVRTRRIAASPAAIWEVLADFGSLSDWASIASESHLVGDQTEGVGMVRKAKGRGITLVETITEWEPGTAMTYTVEGLPFVRGAQQRWTFSPATDGDGGTEVTLTNQLDPGDRVIRKFLTHAVLKRVSKGVAKKLLSSLDDHLGGHAGV